MKAGCAVKVKVESAIPGAAACAVAGSNDATAALAARSSRVFGVAFFIFVALIGSLLALIAALLIDADFGHQPTEVLGIVRQVVKIGGVEIEHAARRILCRVARIQNHVEDIVTRM